MSRITGDLSIQGRRLRKNFQRAITAAALSIVIGTDIATGAELLNGSGPAPIPNQPATQQRATPRQRPEPRHPLPPASTQSVPQGQGNDSTSSQAPPPAIGPNTEPNQAPGVGSWTTQCNESGKDCLMLRRVLRPDLKSQILAMTIARVPNNPELLIGTVMLPLGIAVRESVPITLDERYLASVPIETCIPSGCVLTIPLAPPLLDFLQKATVMKFLLLTPNQATQPISFSMQGFREALAKLKSK